LRVAPRVVAKDVLGGLVVVAMVVVADSILMSIDTRSRISANFLDLVKMTVTSMNSP
jgi:hypothetical protein